MASVLVETLGGLLAAIGLANMILGLLGATKGFPMMTAVAGESWTHSYRRLGVVMLVLGFVGSLVGLVLMLTF
jgi:hypothetical protein